MHVNGTVAGGRNKNGVSIGVALEADLLAGQSWLENYTAHPDRRHL
jgi:hypothetical protein